MATTDVLADVLLTTAGLVHVLPGVVAWSVSRAETAYGVRVEGADLALVLRHRGVLLVLVGIGLVVAPWWPAVEPAAVGAAVISVTSFLLLAARSPGLSPGLRGVAVIDAALLVAIVVAVVLRLA